MWFLNGYGDIDIYVFDKVKTTPIPRKEQNKYFNADTDKNYRAKILYTIENQEAFFTYNWDDPTFNIWGILQVKFKEEDQLFDKPERCYRAIKRVFSGEQNNEEFGRV